MASDPKEVTAEAMSVESDAAAYARGVRAFKSSPTRKREAASNYMAALGGAGGGRAKGGSVKRKRTTKRRRRVAR